MGILSSPSNKNKLLDIIKKYSNIISIVCYFVGVFWFFGLAHQELNAGTYFSENALLPGLVDLDFYNTFGAENYLSELQEIHKKNKMDGDFFSIPSKWLSKKFQDVGLDVYVQNYTFRYPHEVYDTRNLTGQNVYAILRAPRSSGTESLVLSSPFRPDEGYLEKTSAGIALMIGLAKSFRRHSYWAKDIIFLVSDNEEVGIQAWLSAYHHTPNAYIEPDELEGRSGSIQAAINLEIPSDQIGRINIKIEGLNGQLPNLDLVNTAERLSLQEGLSVSIQRRVNGPSWDVIANFFYSLKTMLMMMWNQATGVPTGNHGYFHKYNIESITLQGIKLKNSRKIHYATIGRLVEGIFRSLNNLLERFHQSFFFYLLPSTDRYISIGVYMPPFGLIILPLAIKAITIWILLFVKESDSNSKTNEKLSSVEKKPDISKNVDSSEITEQEKKEIKTNLDDTNIKSDHENDKEVDKIIEDDKKKQKDIKEIQCNKKDKKTPFNFAGLVQHLIIAFILGQVAFNAPTYFIKLSKNVIILPEMSLIVGYFSLHIVVLTYPFLLKRLTRKQENIILSENKSFQDNQLLKCCIIIILGIVLGGLSVMNISMAFYLSIFWVPLVLVLRTSSNRFLTAIQSLLLIILSPMGLLYFASLLSETVLASRKLLDPSDITKLLIKLSEDVMNGMMVSTFQFYMFANWTFPLVTMVFFPIWFLLWCVLHVD